MRIIKVEPPEYRVFCTGCNNHLGYTSKDVRVRYDDEKRRNVAEIACCNCDLTIAVPLSFLKRELA
jgi:RNase P subunit RPR2